jgi:hypothetical protein
MKKRYYIYEIKEQKKSNPKLISDHRSLRRITEQPNIGYPSGNMAKVALRGMLKTNVISNANSGEFIIEPVYRRK